MDGRKWTSKVVKRARGAQGEWFDFPTAGTFASESDARRYAEGFAREQIGVGGARIDVRNRRSGTIASYRVECYAPGF